MDKFLREKFLSLFVDRSVRIANDKPFILASGKTSQYYVDCKATLLTPEGLTLAGQIVWDMVKGYEFDAIGGMTLGADPITLSTAMAAYQDGVVLSPIIVRKQAKDHGTEKWIEGYFNKGARVVVVDDVFTTGGSTLKAIERIREAGLQVVEAIALVDRGEGAAENFAKAGVISRSVFTINELLEAAKQTLRV